MSDRDSDEGLWLGAVPIRRSTAEVTVSTEAYTGLPSVVFTMKPAWQPLLQRETERTVGGRLQLRLDGKVLAEPLIAEPIYGASFFISLNTDEEAERIEAAARA